MNHKITDEDVKKLKDLLNPTTKTVYWIDVVKEVLSRIESEREEKQEKRCKHCGETCFPVRLDFCSLQCYEKHRAEQEEIGPDYLGDLAERYRGRAENGWLLTKEIKNTISTFLKGRMKHWEKEAEKVKYSMGRGMDYLRVKEEVQHIHERLCEEAGSENNKS